MRTYVQSGAIPFHFPPFHDSGGGGGIYGMVFMSIFKLMLSFSVIKLKSEQDSDLISHPSLGAFSPSE